MIENQPAQPQQVNPQAELPPTTPMKKKKPWLVIGLSALSLIFLATTGFFAYQNYQLRRAPPAQGIVRPDALEPSSTPSLTAGWETYENKDYHFTLSYPANWTTEEALIQDMTIPYKHGCVAGLVSFINEEKNLEAYVYYRYSGICTRLGMRTGVGYNPFGDKKTIKIQEVDIPHVYLGEVNKQDTLIKEVFYNNSAFIKIGDLEFLFGTVDIEYDENFSINDQTVEEINSIFKTLRVFPVVEPLEIESILGTAHEYSQAYVSVQQLSNKQEIWDRVEELCADPKFDRELAESYKVVQIDIIGSNPDEDPNYYHIYVNIFTAVDEDILSGNWEEHKNMEILMVKKDGAWKALTWDFFE